MWKYERNEKILNNKKDSLSPLMRRKTVSRKFINPRERKEFFSFPPVKA
jgi:hypothetical protein